MFPMRKIIAFGVLAIAVASIWLVYSRVIQGRREAVYRAAIVPFQRNLHVGMSKADVEKYLHSRSVEYHVSGRTHLIQIGEEPPGNLWCEPWRVYVALEFDPADRLSEVQIRKWG